MPKDLVPALDQPTPTAERKVAQFGEVLSRERFAQELVDGPTSETLPAVDVAALSQQYTLDEAIKPQWKLATFQAPLQATWPQYEQIRDEALKRFIGEMHKQGWDVLASNDYRPRVEPGIYPAHDLMTGFALLDRREFVIGCWFTFRNPKPVKIEVPPSWREPLTLRR